MSSSQIGHTIRASVMLILLTLAAGCAADEPTASPTATQTPVPPTFTAMATPIPPTNTPLPTWTNTATPHPTETNTPTPTPKPTRTPWPTRTITPTPTPLPPFETLVQIFQYDQERPLDLVVEAEENRAGVTIQTVKYYGAVNETYDRALRVPAYLVLPAGNGPFPAVLYLHAGGKSKEQYLDEGVLLAQQGVVSLLIDGPISESRARNLDPFNLPAVRDAYIRTVIDLRRGLDVLESLSQVDPGRLAYVGHSYGATWGGVLAGIETRLRAYVLMAGAVQVSTIDTLGAPELDSILYLGHAAPAAYLFQYAEDDAFISQEQAQLYFDIANEPKTMLWYDTDHLALQQAGQADRLSWLSQQLGFTPQSTATPAPASISFADSGQRLGFARSWDVALGDVDGDGDLDAFVANGLRGGVRSTVWLNAGGVQGGTPGVFTDSQQSLGHGMGVELGDLDGDGDLDALVVSWDEAGKVWLNQGDASGVFADSGQNLGSAGGMDVALGDLDGDGDLDAYVGNEKANTVWLNDGSGAFSDSGQQLGTRYSAGVGLGDLDGDGDLDALAVGWGEPGKVWLNDGAGTFADSGQALTPSHVHIHGLTLGDLDDDGDLDAFLAGMPNQIWFNDGAGVFSASGQSLPSLPGDTAAVGDLDGDGDLDVFLAVGEQNHADDKIWLNQGQGRFTDSGLTLSDRFTSGIGLGDLDGDGDLDAFVVHGALGQANGGNLPGEVWLNETLIPAAAPAPAISLDTVEQVELLYTLSGHSDKVYTVIFSGDGAHLASVSPDKTIRLWDVASGQELHTFGIGEVGMNDIAFAPDGRLLASPEAIWDVASKQTVLMLDQGKFGPVAFSPDGSLLAVAYFGELIKLWDVREPLLRQAQDAKSNDVASGQVVRTLDDQAGNLALSIEFSPDGALLATGGHLNGKVTLWDVEAGEIVHILEHDTQSNFHGVAFAPDGQLLASAATAGTTKVWDVASGELVHALTRGDSCYDATFAPDGSLLATAGCDNTIRLWDTANWQLVRTLNHGGNVMAVAFAPDGTLLASGGYDQKINLWGLPR